MLAGPVMARPVITSASASFAQLGKQEIPTASIATTSPGAAGAGEAPGTAPRIILVCVTPASYRENAASISGAKGYLEYTGELIFCAGRRPAAAPVAKPFLGKPAALFCSQVRPVKISLTLQGQDFLGLVVSSVRGIACQIWKRQFANAPTTSGSPMVNPRARRTSIG